MPPKPPPPDDDAVQRKSTAGHVERLSTPGIPSRFVPRPVSDEVTPPEQAVVMRREREAGRLVPPVARTRVREQTLVGMGPATETPTPRAPVATAPPRSISPVPASSPIPSIPVKIDRKGLRVSWTGVKPYLPYIGFALFGAGGWMAGMKLAGLTVAAVEFRSIAAERAAAKATEDANALRDTEVKFEVKVNGTVSKLSNSWMVEAEANRAERATRDRNYLQLVQDFEALKKAVPAIQGLPPKR